MKEKFSGFLKGEICAAIVLILLGVCLTFIPVQTVGVICKIIFGILMMTTGLYLIVNYLNEKKETTVLELFAGTITVILGGFLLKHPQIVITILPLLLGALVIVDSFWIVRAGLRLRKAEDEIANRFLIIGAVFMVLGLFIMLNLFKKFSATLLFSGIVLIADGIMDIILQTVLKKHKDGLPKIFATEESSVHFGDEKEETHESKPDEDEYEEYDPSYGYQNNPSPQTETPASGDILDQNGNPITQEGQIHLELPGNTESH